MSDKVGFGVVGCGLVSQIHGAAIQATEEAELVASFDMNAERCDGFVEKFGGERAASFDALLQDDRIQVINVLTPNAFHAQFALPAMEAGKHVIVEKPPEMTLEKTDAMIAAAERHGVKLAVSLQVRFRPAVAQMKAAIESGRFGRLLCGDTYMKWFRPMDYYLMDDWRTHRYQGAGVTIQQAFHYLDLLGYLMGPVKRVEARMMNLAHPEVVELEDTVQAFLQYESGATGMMEASTALWPGTDIRLEINGADGTAVMQGERLLTWQFREELPEDEVIGRIGSCDVKTAAGDPLHLPGSEHQCMIEDMIQAIRTGSEPRATAQSARRTLELCLAMYQSADENRPVDLPL